VRRQRETISGIQARNMDKAKRRQKLENEDGQPTVQEFLRLRETDFIAFAIEGTGALGPAVDPFIKQVSQEANNSKSCSSAPAFRRYWYTQLGMCLARGRADAGIDRVCDLCAKSKIEGSTTIPRVADYALSHEFDDLRGEFSDLPVRSDDSDDSSESESSSADDSAVGYGESESSSADDSAVDYGESDSDISVGT